MLRTGLIAQKMGMTRLFGDRRQPCAASPC